MTVVHKAAQVGFSKERAGTAESVIMDRFLSVSFIAGLPAEEKAQVAEQLRSLIATHPAPVTRFDAQWELRIYWVEIMCLHTPMR